MIDLDWFEQFLEFRSFIFIVKYEDFDIDFNDLDLCCFYLSYDFADAFSFIRDFINHNYLVTNFDSCIDDMNITLYISVESL